LSSTWARSTGADRFLITRGCVTGLTLREVTGVGREEVGGERFSLALDICEGVSFRPWQNENRIMKRQCKGSSSGLTRRLGTLQNTGRTETRHHEKGFVNGTYPLDMGIHRPVAAGNRRAGCRRRIRGNPRSRSRDRSRDRSRRDRSRRHCWFPECGGLVSRPGSAGLTKLSGAESATDGDPATATTSIWG